MGEAVGVRDLRETSRSINHLGALAICLVGDKRRSATVSRVYIARTNARRWDCKAQESRNVLAHPFVDGKYRQHSSCDQPGKSSPMFSLRRATQAVTACSLANPSALSSCFGQCRSVFMEKARAGMLVKYDKRIWRIASVTKAQKGQGAATFHVKLNELDSERKKEMSSVAASFDFPEVRYERVKFLFSGYDDDDNACFVYPQHSSKSGQEVNLPASKLKEQHQQFLAVGMPVDMLHIGGRTRMTPRRCGRNSTSQQTTSTP
jgi:translation elongation factor P/translation initiation factor 5A